MVGKKRARRSRKVADDAARTRNPGLPDEKTIVSERTLISPKGNAYRIIRTTETDPYDRPARRKKHS
jgi:hypothetical protein